ncbi:hypothetical protein CDL12_27057 [Handroanthus impetiginosus]|uniref:Uncharacterized protein n=1 Tax=Handroanthus impetiginosus TaxID=429701 RepID=A0A2G9G5N4_9LAMI|nr:hypothetical protein CDL12_27057 [Handroanthus impetiginosus]
MVRPMPMIHIGESFSPIPLAIGLFVSVSLLVALCAIHARQVPKKYTSKTSDPNTPKAPLPSPKHLITTLGHKAMMPLVNGKKSSPQESDTTADGNNKENEEDGNNKENDQENGLWQKAILMGERCQPPEFSGVIYYDYSGNRIPEMPKSPRATSLSPLRSLNFPAQKNENSIC